MKILIKMNRQFKKNRNKFKFLNNKNLFQTYNQKKKSLNKNQKRKSNKKIMNKSHLILTNKKNFEIN